MKPLRVLVEYQSNDYVKILEGDLKRSRELVAALERKVKDLDIKCSDEMCINIQLLDLCRQHGINPRKGLDISKW